MSIRSYVRSTDSHREPRGQRGGSTSRGNLGVSHRQNIFPSIDVAVNSCCSTIRTIPTTNIKGQLFNYKPTMVTPFTTRKESVNLDQFSPVPITFIFQLPKHFSPSGIANRASQLMVFNHVPDGKIFNSNQAIVPNQVSCQLMPKAVRPRGGSLRKGTRTKRRNARG